MSGRRPLFSVESTDEVSVAVHELSSPNDAPPLLISHATGFCGYAYAPLAAALGDRFRSLAMDHRGHGATRPPAGWDDGHDVDWRRFGDDTLAVARAMGDPGRLVGFGHSMGGSSLLMAAHRDPGQFARLVLFEPIARPPEDQPVDPSSWPIVLGARRRKRHFPSFQAAFENFRRKPPLSQFASELDLQPGQRESVHRAVHQGQEGMIALLRTPTASGRIPLDELLDTMLGKPEEAREKLVEIYGMLATERVPGSDRTYSERVESLKGETVESFRREFTAEQFKAFEKTGQDPLEIQIPDSPWGPVLKEALQRRR